MNPLSIRALAALLAGVAAHAAHADGAAELQLRSLAAACAQCHGSDGRALPGSTLPGLAGRPAPELIAALNGFRDGSRPSTLMGQLAKGFSDAQIERLAAYFAAQKP